MDFRFIYLTNLSYWRVSGLEITQFTIPFDITAGSHDIIIEDCEMHHLGIPITQDAKLRVRDSYNLTIRRCQFHHIAGPGVNIAGAAHDILIEDCDSYENDDGRGSDGDGDGFNVDDILTGEGALTNTWPWNITLRRCRVWNVSEDGIDIKADNVLLDRCEVRNAGVNGFKLWSISNVKAVPPVGIAQTRFTVVNCLSYNSGEVGIEFQQGPDVKLLNSTFIQTQPGLAGQGEQVILLPANPSYNNWTGKLYSRNNVFVHLGTTPGGDSYARAMEFTRSTWQLDMDYDVFATPNYPNMCVVRWSDPQRTSLRKYTPTEVEDGTFSSLEGIEAHGRGLLPTFVDVAGGDLHLNPSDTVARDTGQDMSASGVIEDLDGMSRPQGGSFDRGCYEHP